MCKYFLEAVESKKYGWFWVCPNGGKDCMYRHALPPGYVLKSQMKQLLEEEAQNQMSVEEVIEQERHMTKSQTKLTTEVFMEWKRKKREAKDALQAAKRAARAKEDRMRCAWPPDEWRGVPGHEIKGWVRLALIRRDGCAWP